MSFDFASSFKRMSKMSLEELVEQAAQHRGDGKRPSSDTRRFLRCAEQRVGPVRAPVEVYRRYERRLDELGVKAPPTARQRHRREYRAQRAPEAATA